MAFNFNIFAGTVVGEQDGSRSLSKSGDEQQQQAVTPQPQPVREFRPRTPQSEKVGRGERGSLVRGMIAQLESDIQGRNPSYVRDSEVTVEEKETDLDGIDPEVRLILNSFGIFYFDQISSSILTTYGPLLTRSGVQEDYQRLVESNLLDDGVELKQEKLKSQRVFIK